MIEGEEEEQYGEYEEGEEGEEYEEDSELDDMEKISIISNNLSKIKVCKKISQNKESYNDSDCDRELIYNIK